MIIYVKTDYVPLRNMRLLTRNRIYKAVSSKTNKSLFYINTDVKEQALIDKNCCAYLDGRSWTIVSEAEFNEQERIKVFELEEGKRYVTRNGRITGLMKYSFFDGDSFVDTEQKITSQHWSRNGRFISDDYDSPLDLVRECVEEDLSIERFESQRMTNEYEKVSEEVMETTERVIGNYCDELKETDQRKLRYHTVEVPQAGDYGRVRILKDGRPVLIDGDRRFTKKELLFVADVFRELGEMK